jgi:integrase
VSGKPVRITLGRYPVLGLSEARKAARIALEEAAAGGDPRPEPPAPRKTLDAMIDEFEARHLVKLRPKSRVETLRYLRGRFLQRFAGRAPETLKRAEIQALLDDMIDEGRATSANRMLAAVRKLLNWAVERGELDVSPCMGLRSPAREVQRDRFLSMEEVARLWEASKTLSPINRAFIRILLLTGQRRESVAQLRRSQITGGVWSIPREAMKGGRRHTLPLPSLVLDIINETPATGEGDLVFSVDGERRIGGFSKLKSQLDAASGLSDWRLHDLRRTAGTHIARLGFPRIVVSKILGHTEAGVTQIYELYTYDAEKREALEAWAGAVFEAAHAGMSGTTC